MKKIFILILLLISCGCSKTEEKIIEEEKVEIPIVEEVKEKRMSLVSVGDVLIHEALYVDAKTSDGYDFSYMFTEIEPMIKDYDLKYMNQESVIGGKKLGLSHYPTFNSPEEIGDALVDIGFNMVSLANNHSYDKREIGVLNSVEYWKSKDVVYDGQSSTLEERNNIKIYEQNDIKYAFLAYTESINGFTLPSDKSYLVNIYSEEQVKKDIDEIKDKVDVIIVSMHWGVEYTHTPNNSQKEIASYLSSLGVDLIIGTHPHVIQPVDYIGDTLVIYSLGNFVSGQLPLGLDKIIGLMVGVDIVVKEDKVTFENIKYDLLYTYSTNRYTNYKVIPFKNLSDDILLNHKQIESEYLQIVESKVTYGN